ncbi:MAG: ribosomal protein S18-alanine N-acetyltransferase [Kordiimonadaceae bacterium]|nr:ribosomal protein S18-alanine N-acetyltransferase [Kordiimonadaceae bacterium]
MADAGDIGFTQAGEDNEAAFALMAQLHRRAFMDQGVSPWTANSFRQLLNSTGMAAYLCSKDECPVGFYLYRIVLDEAELVSIGVDPLFQGQGFALLMLMQMQEQLKAQAVKSLFLEVRKDNAKATKIYTDFGFKKVGERKAYYQIQDGSRVDALVFALEIQAE